MPLEIGTVVDGRYRVVACLRAGSPREFTRIFEQPRQATAVPGAPLPSPAGRRCLRPDFERAQGDARQGEFGHDVAGGEFFFVPAKGARHKSGNHCNLTSAIASAARTRRMGLSRQSASQPGVYLEGELASQQAATNPFQAADERGSTPITRVLFIRVERRSSAANPLPHSASLSEVPCTLRFCPFPAILADLHFCVAHLPAK
jgi:hypothetical protein